MDKCPGTYCGRMVINGSLDPHCGACPTGFRSLSNYQHYSPSTPGPSLEIFSHLVTLISTATPTSSECIECNDTLALQDWLYLLFMACLLLLIEWSIVDHSVKRRGLPFEVMTLHISAATEVTTAAFIVIIIMSTISSKERLIDEQVSSITSSESSSSSSLEGSPGRKFSSDYEESGFIENLFRIRSCRVIRISDFYPIFFNPRNLSCTQEAVYPLFSMVLMFYAFSLLNLLLLRPIVIAIAATTDKVNWKQSHAIKSIYLTLYLIPSLVLIHILLCGVIYYLYPYLTIIGSLISLAIHFACRLNQSTRALFKDSIRQIRNLVIILGHWFLHSLGLIALTHFRSPLRDSLLLLCVPFPTLFYILTARFSDPQEIQD